MKKIILVLISSVFLSQLAFSQAITEKEMQKIRTAYNSNDRETKAITNAVCNNDIRKLALNNENKAALDFYFSDKVKTKGITNQESSGRCWLFASFNVMRPKVIEKYNLSNFEFSYNYSFFWDQFEKANLYLEAIIASTDKENSDKTVEWLLKHPINDGGVWNGFVNVAEKYGLVPAEIMPETHNSNNTKWVSTLVGRKLREAALTIREMAANKKKNNEIRDYKVQILGEIYRILAINFGEPPSSFEWRYEDAEGKISETKEYTPQSFYQEFIEVNLSDYIMLMNDPSREYYKLYEIEHDRNVYEGTNWRYINLPNEEIKKFAIASIKDNEALYFSCDVGKQLNSDKGLLDINNYDYESLFGVKFSMDKKQRIQSFESGSSHGMTLVAVDLDNEEKPTKWLLENSWGMKGFKGHLVMTDQWFDEYMFRVVVNKKYIPDNILKILEQKAIMLPPWDPMFAPEE